MPDFNRISIDESDGVCTVVLPNPTVCFKHSNGDDWFRIDLLEFLTVVDEYLRTKGVGLNKGESMSGLASSIHGSIIPAEVAKPTSTQMAAMVAYARGAWEEFKKKHIDFESSSPTTE